MIERKCKIRKLKYIINIKGGNTELLDPILVKPDSQYKARF